MKKVDKEAVPVKATSSWQLEKRSSERKHVPPKRYGIDLVVKCPRDSQKKEEKATEEKLGWTQNESKQFEPLALAIT